jgi:hypothetical protein
MTPHLEASPPAYVPRDPSQTVLYHVVADHLETFLASLDADLDARGLPSYVQREFYDYLWCNSLPMACCGWAVIPASTSCFWPLATSAAGFVRHMPGGAWPRPPPTWSSACSPGGRHANGSSRYRSSCGTGWPLHRTSPPWSIRSFAPRSGSIM